MDARRFDTLARIVSTAGSRRRAVATAVGGALALLGLADLHDAAAKKAYEAADAADSSYAKASASLARIMPLAGGDTTSVDLSALVAEFHSEVERRQVTAVDSAEVVDTTEAVE